MDSSSSPVRRLWTAFLVVWALTLLFNGAVKPWALAATAAAMAALNVAAMIALPGPLQLSRTARIFLAACGTVFLIHLLPGLPFLFPRIAAMRELHGVGGGWPATADAGLTLRALGLVAAYALAALFVLRLRQNGLSSSRLLKGVCIVLVLEALYALAQAAFGFSEIPFFGPRPHAGVASGTLVNRNSFAGLMAMGLAVAAGLAFLRVYQKEKALMWGLAAALFIAALVLSKSRGGAIAAFTAVIVIPFLYRGSATALGVLVVLILCGAAALVADPSGLLERFGDLDKEEVDSSWRWKFWRTTLEGAAHQPVLGYGIGTHPQAYHPFQPPEIGGQVQHAHNEYVNAIFEGGAVWFSILVGGLGLWYARVRRILARLQGPDRIPVIVAVSAVTAIAVHSIVDFDLQIPSIGLLFAAMIALGTSKSRHGLPLPRAAWIGVCASALAVFVPLPGGSLGLSPYDYRAAWASARSTRDEALADRRFETAADLWPAHAGLQREAGLYFWEGYAETRDVRHRERATRCLRRLFAQRPETLPDVLREIWTADLPSADFEALLPDDPAAATTMAGYLVQRGRWEIAFDLFARRVPPTAAHAPALDAFAAELERAGQWGLEARVRELRLGAKPDASAHAAAAHAWNRLGVPDRALERASGAAQIDPGNPAWHLLRGDLLRAQGDRAAAMEAYTEAVRTSLGKSEYLLRRAAIYQEERMHGFAAEDYRSALRARPGDRAALFGLVRALTALGDAAAARRLLDEHLIGNPADAEALRLRELMK